MTDGNFMKKYTVLILIGLFFAAPGEILNHFVFNPSSSGLSGFVRTMIIYVVFLSIVWSGLRFLFKKYSRLAASLVSYLIVGFVGLMIEWFIIGNSPWQNPEANDLGMFTFWGTMVLAPLILTDMNISKKFRKTLWIYFLAASIISLILGVTSRGDLRFLGLLIWIYSTIGLNVFYLKYFWFLKKNSRIPALGGN